MKRLKCFSQRSHLLSQLSVRRVIGSTALWATVYSATVYSALVSSATFAQVVAVEQQSIKAGIETQKIVEKLDDETTALAADYRTTVKQQEDLIKYNKQLRDILTGQDDELASLQSQLQLIGHLESEIVPLMSDMLETLDEFVALDVPFLLEERNNRSQNLKTLLASSSITNSEKYRRVLEAYQIENDYGRTIEAWDAELGADSKQVVTFLRIGRLIYLYQTLDGQQSYYWDKNKHQWLPLDAGNNEQIARGIKMAREQIPSDLLLLPLSLPRI